MSSHIDELILEAKLNGHTNLYLNYQHLSELPPTLIELTEAERIYLKYNILTKLPKDIWRLASLVELYLHSNNLQELPEEIGYLECLESLDVSHNYLHSLTSSIGQLRQLSHLHLANNHLNVLPKEIGSLHQLRVLDVMSNHLTWLPWQLCHCSFLETLSFDGNDVGWLPQQLTGLKHLKELSGSRNKLRSLPQDIDHMISLESLLIDSNCSLCALPATLLRIAKLTTLGINRCNIDDSCKVPGSEGYFHGVLVTGDRVNSVLPLLELAARASHKLGRSQSFCLPSNLRVILQSPLGHCYNCRQAFFVGLFLHTMNCKSALAIAQQKASVAFNADVYRNVELEFVFATCSVKCMETIGL